MRVARYPKPEKMVRHVLITVAVILTLATADANAATARFASGSAPDEGALVLTQGTLSRSLLPWPDAALEIRFEEMPCNGQGRACAGAGGSVSMSPADAYDSYIVLHEGAHALIDPALTDAERVQWERWIVKVGLLPAGEPGWWSPRGDDPYPPSPAEIFADAWADCSAYRRPGDRPTGYGYDARNSRRAETCTWLYSLGASRGWAGGEAPEVTAARIAEQDAAHARQAARCVHVKHRMRRLERRYFRARRAHHQRAMRRVLHRYRRAERSLSVCP